jgi:hypothetical protein
MKKQFKRLQGAEWQQYRKTHKLELRNIQVSNSGNYRAVLKDEDNNYVYHWLNNEEASKLEMNIAVGKYNGSLIRPAKKLTGWKAR